MDIYWQEINHATYTFPMIFITCNLIISVVNAYSFCGVILHVVMLLLLSAHILLCGMWIQLVLSSRLYHNVYYTTKFHHKHASLSIQIFMSKQKKKKNYIIIYNFLQCLQALYKKLILMLNLWIKMRPKLGLIKIHTYKIYINIGSCAKSIKDCGNSYKQGQCC